MPDILHKFVSAKADGGDATLVRPSNWNDDHAWPHAYDVGTLTLLDGQFEFQSGRLIISSTNRYTMAGTARMIIFGWFGLPEPVMYLQVGYPKDLFAPFRLRDGYEWEVIGRLTIGGQATRGVLEGDCDLIVSDDFKARSRIVLAGVG